MKSQVNPFAWSLPAVSLGEDFLVFHDTYHGAEA